jgi:HAD superfamily hydrolase (TIGR01509 family)
MLSGSPDPSAVELSAQTPWICKLPSRLEPLPGRIDGLLFDACNVLYDDTAWRRWLLRRLRQLGLETSYRCFFRLWERDFLTEVYCGRRSYREALAALLRSAGLSHGQIEEAQAACEARSHVEGEMRPLTGLRRTMEQLHAAGLILGVICNSEHLGIVLRERFDRFGFGQILSAVVSSRELGRAMPDPACYLAALAGMRLPPERVVFIGHDAAQLAGATALGMATVAFNSDPDARAQRHLDCLDDLLPLTGRPQPSADSAGSSGVLSRPEKAAA